jgi:glucokinase
MKALALDIGGTHISCAIVDDRRMLATESISADSAQSLRSMLPLLANTLRNLMNRVSTSPTDCAGVAIAFPGIIDTRSGRILSTLKKYEDAPSLDLTAWSQTEFGLPLRIENDARMALLGERHSGAAVDHSDIVMMTLGTGIGGAAMIQGKLLRGVHAQAGSLGGHLPVAFEGRLCSCGNIGCAEAEAAGWSMPLVARAWPGFESSTLAQTAEINFRLLFEQAAQGDTVAVGLRDRCLNVWAANAVAQVHAYDPEVVLLGGGVMSSADVIVPYVEAYVHRHAWTPWGKPAIRAAQLGNDAALLGAVPLLSEVA